MRVVRAVILSCGSNEEGVAAKLWKTVYKTAFKNRWREIKKKGLRLTCKWNRKLSSAKRGECSSDGGGNGILSQTAPGIGAETARKHPVFWRPGLVTSCWMGNKHKRNSVSQSKNDKIWHTAWFIQIYLENAGWLYANLINRWFYMLFIVLVGLL